MRIRVYLFNTLIILIRIGPTGSYFIRKLLTTYRFLKNLRSVDSRLNPKPNPSSKRTLEAWNTSLIFQLWQLPLRDQMPGKPLEEYTDEELEQEKQMNEAKLRLNKEVPAPAPEIFKSQQMTEKHQNEIAAEITRRQNLKKRK